MCHIGSLAYMKKERDACVYISKVSVILAQNNSFSALLCEDLYDITLLKTEYCSCVII